MVDVGNEVKSCRPLWLPVAHRHKPPYIHSFFEHDSSALWFLPLLPQDNYSLKNFNSTNSTRWSFSRSQTQTRWLRRNVTNKAHWQVIEELVIRPRSLCEGNPGNWNTRLQNTWSLHGPGDCNCGCILQPGNFQSSKSLFRGSYI